MFRILLDKQDKEKYNTEAPGTILTDPIPVEILSDDVIEDAAGKKSRQLKIRAVGSIANKVYESGRIIPDDVQKLGIQRTKDSGRQLTSFVEHPDPFEGIFGDIKKVAGRVDKFEFDGTNTNIQVTIGKTPNGKVFETILDSGILLGVSQRARGREEFREVEVDSEEADGEKKTLELAVVTDISGIYGYDFVQLDAANAGNNTQVQRISDSVLHAARKIQDAAEEPEEDEDPMTEAEKKALEELKKQNASLVDQMKALSGRLEDALKAKDEDTTKPVMDAVASLLASADVIVQDDKMEETERNTKLSEIAGQLQDAFSDVTGIKPEPEDAAKLDSIKTATQAGKDLRDSLAKMTKKADETKRASSNVTFLDSHIAELGAEGFSEEDKKTFRERILDSVEKAADEKAVEQIVVDALKMVNMGRAKEKLVQLGYKPKATEGQDPAVDENAITDAKIEGGKDFLHGVAFLADKCRESGHFNALYDHKTGKTISEQKEVHPALRKIIDRFDKLHSADLRKEQDMMLKAGGGKALTDQSVHADFETPYTIARMVLFEAYADDIVPGITDMGTMDNDRDKVPITRWRRESNNEKTFSPSVQARSEIMVGELQAIPSGKLTTEWYPIEAEARKLRSVMSDEFITRAKRRPDITGIAMALNNLVQDVRRCIQQDVFYEIIRGACLTAATAFASTNTGNASLTQFQVTTSDTVTDPIGIDAEKAVTVIPGSETVDIEGNIIPRYGSQSTGGHTGAAYFYVIDYALALVTVVDSNGDPLAVPNAEELHVAGLQVGGINGTRFDLTDPSGVAHEDHMNQFLYSIQNLQAQLPSNYGYEPNMVLTDRITGTLAQQAKAYQADGRRRAFRGDGKIVDGNFGVTADLRHFASKVWPGSFVVIGDSMATLWRVYEPMILQGPEQTRDGNGQLTGGKEWYSYQEDSLDVPIAEKLSVITVYNS